MKKSILILAAFALLGGLYAQSQGPDVQQALTEAVNLYQLDSEQAVEMLKIQERHFSNLGEIESLRESDRPLFLQKKNSIRELTQASTRRLLNEQQISIYNQQLIERRKREAALKERLKMEGASKEEIQYAIWDLE
jgi:hypothetical protein